MASIDLSQAPSGVLSTLRAGLARLATSIGTAFVAYAEASSRSAEVTRLQGLSDDRLAEMGIKREDICHHVFRDIFYI